MSQAKVLIYDIETSLQLVSVFQLQHNDYIDPDSIVQERHVISICYKWLGERKIHAISLLDDPRRFSKNPHDDAYVVTEFHKVLAEADCTVAHNGDQFDQKYLKTRMLVHKLPALPPTTSIDTYKLAKQHFLFNSNRLDYLGKLLGFGGKKPTPKGLWMQVLKADPAAIKTMVEYNKRDVDLLEKVFLKLRPYAANYVNRQLFGQTAGCPRCGSTHVQSRGTHKAISRTYRRFQCQKCHGWFREMKPTSAATSHRIL